MESQNMMPCAEIVPDYINMLPITDDIGYILQ